MIRQVTARVYVMRNGVRLTELKADGAPNIYADSSAAIKTSLSGSFRPNDAVNWLSDELAPCLILDGTEYPVGIFRAAAVSIEVNEHGSKNVQVEAYDRCYILKQRRTETILHFGAGTNYIDAVESLLTACGIALVLKTPTSAVLATDREDWDMGTDYLTIANALLTEINYKELWFNGSGFAVLEPRKQPEVESIQHVYDASSVNSMMLKGCTIQTDMFDKPNVFVAVVSNPDYDEPIVKTAENNSPLSPYSIIRRGFRVVQVEKVSNIADATALQEYVNNLCFQSMRSSEVIQITTALMPDHGIGDIVALNHPDITGICEETAWYMELKAGGEMTHELKKVVYQ